MKLRQSEVLFSSRQHMQQICCSREACLIPLSLCRPNCCNNQPVMSKAVVASWMACIKELQKLVTASAADAGATEAFRQRLQQLDGQPPLPHAAWKKLVQDVQVEPGMDAWGLVTVTRGSWAYAHMLHTRAKASHENGGMCFGIMHCLPTKPRSTYPLWVWNACKLVACSVPFVEPTVVGMPSLLGRFVGMLSLLLFHAANGQAGRAVYASTAASN